MVEISPIAVFGSTLFPLLAFFLRVLVAIAIALILIPVVLVALSIVGAIRCYRAGSWRTKIDRTYIKDPCGAKCPQLPKVL